MKTALLTASLVLIAGGATACGDDNSGGGGSGASKDDFCGNFKDLSSQIADLDPTALSSKDGLKDYVKKLKDAVDKIKDTGVPDGIPDDAKAGYDADVKTIESIPDDASLSDLSKIEAPSDTDQKNEKSFDDYLKKECPGVDLGSPS